MSAAAERAAFAVIGRDLLAMRGGPGERRAAALVALPSDPPPSRFDRLSAAPDWLRWPHDRQAELARAVALRVLAPSLAASIDGGWLGSIAAVAGDNALDWAIALGGEVAGDRPAVVPEDLAAAGFATLRASLPPDLRGYVRVDVTRPLPADAAMIAEAVAFVQADAA